jgi:hypothetical protein
VTASASAAAPVGTAASSAASACATSGMAPPSPVVGTSCSGGSVMLFVGPTSEAITFANKLGFGAPPPLSGPLAYVHNIEYSGDFCADSALPGSLPGTAVAASSSSVFDTSPAARWGDVMRRSLTAARHKHFDAIREDLEVAMARDRLGEFVIEGAVWVPIDAPLVLAVVRTTAAIKSEDDDDGFSTTIPSGTVGCISWCSDESIEVVFAGLEESLLIPRAFCGSLEKEAGYMPCHRRRRTQPSAPGFS